MQNLAWASLQAYICNTFCYFILKLLNPSQSSELKWLSCENSSSLNFEQTCLTLTKGQDYNFKIDSEDLFKWTLWYVWEQGSQFCCIYPIIQTILHPLTPLKLLRTQSFISVHIQRCWDSNKKKSCKIDPEERLKEPAKLTIGNCRDKRRYWINPCKQSLTERYNFQIWYNWVWILTPPLIGSMI